MPVTGPTGPGSTSSDVLELDDVHVSWGANLVLHGVSARIPTGQTVALTGANGSGKSSLLRAILGSAPITVGRVLLFGQDTSVSRRIPWERIGYVPQRVSSGGGVASSAVEVVRSGVLGRRRWWATRADTERSLEALRRVGLVHRSGDPMSTLSGGQQQRVLIARALVRDPDLLIMDEPMAGIDAHSRERLAEIVAELHEAGTTVLVVLHELGELGPLLDRELHLGAGHLTYDGPPRGSGDAFDHHVAGDTAPRTPQPRVPLLTQLVGRAGDPR